MTRQHPRNAIDLAGAVPGRHTLQPALGLVFGPQVLKPLSKKFLPLNIDTVLLERDMRSLTAEFDSWVAVRLSALPMASDEPPY